MGNRLNLLAKNGQRTGRVERIGDNVNNTNESFYHRFTLPEERKNRTLTSIEWGGGYRWFVSPNVVKLEDCRPPGEIGRILERLRQHKRAQAKAAVANILAKAQKRRLAP
jgi:hypothetical protein